MTMLFNVTPTRAGATATNNWDKIKAGQYRTSTGRFTISKIDRGRCYRILWVLRDNSRKREYNRYSLRDAKQAAADLLVGVEPLAMPAVQKTTN